MVLAGFLEIETRIPVLDLGHHAFGRFATARGLIVGDEVEKILIGMHRELFFDVERGLPDLLIPNRAWSLHAER